MYRKKANSGPLGQPPLRVGLAMLGGAAYKAKRARAPAAKTIAKLAPLTAAAPVGTTAGEEVAEPVVSTSLEVSSAVLEAEEVVVASSEVDELVLVLVGLTEEVFMVVLSTVVVVESVTEEVLVLVALVEVDFGASEEEASCSWKTAPLFPSTMIEASEPVLSP